MKNFIQFHLKCEFKFPQQIAVETCYPVFILTQKTLKKKKKLKVSQTYFKHSNFLFFC